jgi:hypothetical protein
MDQIKNSPEIAPSDISELMESVAAAGLDTSATAATLSAFTPKPVKKTTTAVTTAIVTHSAPPVLKRPVKLPDGTPLKRDKTTAAGGAAQHVSDGVAATTTGVKRRFSKRSLDEEPVNGKSYFLCTGTSVAVPDPGWVKKTRIWTRDEHNPVHISESLETILLGLKYLNSLMRIRDPG